MSGKQRKSKRSETKNKENRKQLHIVTVNSSVPTAILNVWGLAKPIKMQRVSTEKIQWYQKSMPVFFKKTS